MNGLVALFDRFWAMISLTSEVQVVVTPTAVRRKVCCWHDSGGVWSFLQTI